MVDRAILRGTRRLKSEIESMPWLANDVDEIWLLWFRQLRPCAATYLALAATARIVSKDFGGDKAGEQAFIDGAMDHVFELTGWIEVPDSIAAEADPDQPDDALYHSREVVRIASRNRFGPRPKQPRARRPRLLGLGGGCAFKPC